MEMLFKHNRIDCIQGGAVMQYIALPIRLGLFILLATANRSFEK